MKRCFAAIVALALVVAGLPLASAQAKPLDVLKKMGETYSKMDQMSCKFTMNMPVPGMGNMTIPTEMKMQRPNKFRMEVGGMMPVTTVSDGSNMFVFVPAMNVYQKSEAPASVDFRGASSGPMGDLNSQGDLMGTLMRPDSEAALTNLAKTATLLGEESAGGLLCHHMRIEMVTGAKAELWVDKEKGLLRKMQMDMAELMAAMRESMGEQGAAMAAMMGNLKPGQMIMVQEYSDYNLSPTFADDTFRFAPPSGARQVDFNKMAAEMMGAGAAPAGAGQPATPSKKAPANY